MHSAALALNRSRHCFAGMFKGNGAKSVLHLGSLFAATVLSACTMVGPDYAPPPVQTSAQWIETDNTRIKAESSELRDWWSAFNDPVLNSLVRTAYDQNLPLRVAGIRVLQARARLAIAIGEFYPQQQLAFGDLAYTRQSKSFAQPGTDLDYRSAEIGAGASWELDFWGKFRRAIEAEDANLLASMASYDDVLVTLLGDVANTYVTVRVLEEQVAIAQKNAAIQRETLKIAQARFQGGQTSELDAQQALTQLRSTEATIPDLQLSLQQTKNALAILLGMTPAEVGARLGSSSIIPIAPDSLAAGIPAELLRRRPDVRLAEFVSMAESSRIGVIKAELYPAFSLSGRFGLAAADSHGDLGDIFDISSRTAVVGPSFDWNFLNYGQITNAIREQDARLQEALVNYQNTVLVAQREVEDGLISFVKARETVGYLTQAVAAARRTVELARIQYEGGQSDYTTVITAQSSLLQQENVLAFWRGAVPQGMISVYRALGGGWQIREGSDFAPESVKDEMRRRTD